MKKILQLFGKLFLLISFIWIIAPDSASALVGYQYRQILTINNSGGPALTNYQVLFTVNTQALIAASKMQPDGDDIRFTTFPSCGTFYCYSIEKPTLNTVNTKIWIKIPNIPANGNMQIQFWYGNPSAALGEDPVCTFDFFDDFDGNQLDASKWRINNRSGSHTIGGGQLSITANGEYTLRSNVNINTICIVEAFVISSSGNWPSMGQFFGAPNNTQGYVMFQSGTTMMGSNVAFTSCTPEGWVAWVISMGGAPIAPNGIWYMDWPSSTEQNIAWNNFGSTANIAARLNAINPPPQIQMGLGGLCSGSARMVIEWARARRWTRTPPRVQAGPEETNIVLVSPPNPQRCSSDPPTPLVANGGINAPAVTYTWSSGDVGPSVGVSPVVTTTYTVTSDDGNGCGNTATVTVTVLPAPVLAPTRNPAGTICPGQTVTLDAGGNANNYTWTPGNLSGKIVTVNPLVTTTYTVSGPGGNGCIGTGTITVTVFNTPVNVQINPNSPSRCTADPPTVLTASGASTYVWSHGPTTAAVSESPLVTTTYTVTGTSVDGCTGTATATINVTQTPAQPSAVTGPTQVCLGPSPIRYSVVNQPGVTFTWTTTTPGISFSGGSPSGHIQDITFDPGPGGPYPVIITIIITPRNGNCVGPTRTFTVTLITNPAQPGTISGGTSFCPNAPVENYSIAAVPTATVYLWSITPGVNNVNWRLTPQGQNTTTITWITPGTYNVCVLANNSCGNSPSQCLTVTVNPNPPAPTAANITNPVCPNQRGTTYSVNNVSGTTYNWTVPNGTTIASGQGTDILTLDWGNMTPGLYNIRVTPTRLGCTGATLTIPVLVNDPPPPATSAIQGLTPVCQGAIETYQVGILPTATNYQWSVSPSGPTISGQGTNIISVNWGNSPRGNYTLSVVPSNSCGAGPATTLTVALESIPLQPTGITGPPYHCLNTQRTYTVQPIANATSYTWTNSCGWSGTSTTNSITYTATTMGPCVISVTANNFCGSSPAATLTVTPIDVPAQPAPISGLGLVCIGQIENYSVTAVPNVTYMWTGLPNGASVTQGQGTNSVTIDWGAAAPGNYTIRVIPSNLCGNGTEQTLAVTIRTVPNQPQSLAGPTSICEDAISTYSVTNVIGVTYTWSISPSGPLLTPSGSSAIVAWNNRPGTYVITVTPSNACGNGVSASITIRVSDKPTVDAGMNTVVCGPNTVLMGSPTGGVWTCEVCPVPAQIVSAGPFGIITRMSPATHVFKYSVTDPVCGVVEDFVTVTNDLPIPGYVTSDATVCGGENGTLQLIGYTPGARVIRWERSTDNFVSGGNPVNNTSDTYTYTNITETTQFRAVLIMNGLCNPIHSGHATITVRPNSPAQVVNALVTVCTGEAIVNAVLPQSGTGSWSYVTGPGGAQIVTSGAQGIISGMNVSGDYVFRWTIDNPPCAPSTRDVVVRRLEGVPAANAGPNQRVCADVINLIGNLPPNVTGVWSFVTGPVPAVVVTAGQTGLVSGMTDPGAYVFRWTLSNATCNQSKFADVVITRYANPTPAIAGQNQFVCGPTATVRGNDPSNGTGTWSFVSGPVGATPSISTNGVIGTIFNMTVSGDYVFRWTIDNGVCPKSTSDVTITRVDAASAASVPQSNYNICDVENITLMADPALGGVGVWEYIQGPVQANISTNGSQGLATGLTDPGTYKFRWKVTNGCGTSEVQVTVNRGETFSPPPFAGSNQKLCETSNTLLIGSQIPAGYTGLWRFVSGPMVASVSTFGTFGSAVNMDIAGPYVFTWEISNGGVCPTQYAQVTITRVSNPTPADAGSNQTICGTSTTLQGNVPLSGEGSWTFVTGPSVANVSFTNNVASVSNMNLPGEYVFRYTISNPPCTPSTSEVRVQVNPGTSPGNLSGGGTVCSGSNSGTLNLSNYSGDIVRWEKSTDNFVSLAILNNITSLQTYSNLTQTTWYRAVVKQGGCGEQTSNVVKITVTPAPIQANGGANQTICGNSINLQGNDPMGQTAVWSQVSGPAANLNQIGRLAVITGMSAGTYVFSYTITSGSCGSSISNVVVKVEDATVGGNISSPMTVCGTTNSGTLTATGFVGNIVRWESSTDNFGTIITYNNTDMTQDFFDLTETTQFRAIVKNGNCPEMASSAVTITVVPDGAMAEAGMDQTICGVQSRLIGSDPGLSGTGTWTFTFSDNGVTPTVLQSGNEANILGMSQVGVYTFKYTVTNPVCGTSFDEVTITRSEGSIGGAVSTDYTVCKGENQGTLQLGGYTGEILRWEQSNNNWLTWVNINNTTPVMDFLNLTETTQFRGVVQTAGCSEAKSFHATVYVLDLAPVANAGLDQTICGTGTTMTGNYDQGIWSFVSGPNSPILTQASGIAQANNMTAGVYQFQFTIDNGACGITSDVVNIHVQPSLAAGSVTNDMTVCGQNNSGTLTLSGQNGNVIGWEYSTDGFVQDINFTNNTNTIQSFTNLLTTTYFRAKIGLTGCGTAYSLWAKVTVLPGTEVAQAGFPQEICGSSVTLTGNMPVNGTPTWSIVNVPNGANPILTQSQNMAAVVGMNVPGVYRFRYSISNAPCGSNTADVTVTVSAPTVSGQLTANPVNVCMGQPNSGMINLTGQVGTVVRWERSEDNQNFSALQNTLTSFTFTNLTKTTWYRAVVKSGMCMEMTTQPIAINVNAMTVGGMTMGSATVCIGSNSGILTVSGYTGNIIRWERSTDGFVTVFPINVNTNTYNFINEQATIQYRAVIQNPGCTEQNSSPATITVTNSSVGGTISGATTVCSGVNSGMLNLTGQVGNVIQWEYSDDMSFQNAVILQNQSTSQGFSGLTQDRYFRAKVGSGNCASVYSSVAVVTVSGPSSGGMVNSPATVCTGNNNGVMSLSGQVGSVVRWEYSINGGQSWLNLPPNVTTLQNYNNLTQTTSYRAVVVNGACAEAVSMPAQITVSPASVSGTISGANTVCANVNNGMLNLTGQVGEVVRWESSMDCSGFSNAVQIPVTVANYTYNNLTMTTCFRAIVRSGGCSEAQTPAVRVEVTPGSNAGTINGATTVCGVNASGTLVAVGTDGAVLRWEISADGNNWSPVNNVTTTLTYNGLVRDTWYRIVVKRGNCPEAISAPAMIMVSPPTVGGTLAGSISNACNGSNGGNLDLTGEVGMVVRWEMSVGNGPFVTIPGAQGNSYSYSNLTETTRYRVVVKSGSCSEGFSSIATVNVLPELMVSAGSVTGCNLTANITAVAQGGSGGYIYSIDPRVAQDNSTGNFSGIDPGVYTITVRDNAGCTSSTIVTVSAGITPTQIVAVTNITSSSALVQWASVPPGAGVTYNLRYRVLGQTTWTIVTNIAINNRFLNGLQNNTTYEIEVQYACPNNGPISGFSTGLINQFTTKFMGTGDCVTSGSNNVPIPGGIYINSIGARESVVHWNLVPNAAGYIIGYGLQSQNPSTWTQVVVCDPTNSFTMTNLNPNTQYGVRVRTNCSNCTTALNNLDKRSIFSSVYNWQTLSSRDGEELSNNDAAVVYPNPNKGTFSILFQSVAGENIHVRMLDVTGRVVLDRVHTSVSGENELPVEMVGYSSGVYLLQFERNGVISTMKVIVE